MFSRERHICRNRFRHRFRYLFRCLFRYHRKNGFAHS